MNQIRKKALAKLEKPIFETSEHAKKIKDKIESFIEELSTQTSSSDVQEACTYLLESANSLSFNMTEAVDLLDQIVSN